MGDHLGIPSAKAQFWFSFPLIPLFVDENCPRKEVRCVLRILRREMICLIWIYEIWRLCAIMIYTRSLRYGSGEAVSLTRIMNVRDVLDHILNTISLLALHHSITSLSHQRKAPGLHRIIEQHMSNVLHCLIVAFECKALKASVISSGHWPKSICGLGEEQTSQ